MKKHNLWLGAVACGWVISGVYAQVNTDSVQETVRSQSLITGSQLNAINAEIAKIQNCANQGKFYVSGTCQAAQVTNMSSYLPKMTGVTVRVVGGHKNTTWYGACTGSTITCGFGCTGRTAWVDMVGNVAQPYYCPSLGNADVGGICSDMDHPWMVGVVAKCKPAVPGEVQPTATYIDGNGNTYVGL